MTGRRRFWVVNGTLAVVVVTLALLGANTVFHKASAHAAVRTVTAGLGNVEATVSASGNVSPDQTENVSFATGGSVTAVDVALGQRVSAGQVLGKLDPGPAQASLTAAQDNLTAAQDNLALAQSGGETPPQQAQDAATISSANQQISTAQAALAAAEQQLATDQATCAAEQDDDRPDGGPAPEHFVLRFGPGDIGYRPVGCLDVHGLLDLHGLLGEYGMLGGAG